MLFRARLVAALILALLPPTLLRAASAAPAVGPFFEPTQPFFQSPVEVFAPAKGQKTGENFVVRGILLPLASGHCVLFDQELMRVAAIWKIPAGGPPVSLLTVASVSYENIRKKVGGEHPRPTGPVLLSTRVHPGVGGDAAALLSDPRPAAGAGDVGRGPLPAEQVRFEGVELAGETAILRYHVGTTSVSEWYEPSATGGEVLRHLEVAAHAKPLAFAVGDAVAAEAKATSNAASFVVSGTGSDLVATLAPSTQTQRVTLALSFESTAPTAPVAATPPLPRKKGGLRWSGSASAPAQLNALAQNGLVLDRIATPDENPWARRVRVADLAFLTDDRAAVVTYDGDVWLVSGFADPQLAQLTWRRFASGLNEPLAIAAPQGIIQVATKNGVVRLHDRDGDGEADWFENFSDLVIQSQSTRSFPLDMAIGPDGSTYYSQGGIVNRSGMAVGGEGTAHTGAVVKISPDGRKAELVSRGAREPFVTVHPKTGVVTATDQQGHYICSSVCYLVRPGDNFGYVQNELANVTPPLAWVPYDQDTSSTSEVWMVGEGMGPWNGRLLHLSYGTGRVFVITPDLDAPVPQGAVIPLDLKTELPLLHARMNPSGSALFFAGFQIWGTRTTSNWALGRLRPGGTPVATAVAARSCADGVILEFATPLDPASLGAEKIIARGWNYKRSSAYGSGRYALDGTAGTTPWGVAQTVLSADLKSVFIHLPKLPAMAQLEVRHDFRLANGAVARGVVYFTVNQPRPLDLAQAGFAKVDLTKAAQAIVREKEPAPTVAQGKELAVSLGCAVCHSADGTTEGKVGPTWRRLFGSKRTFIDGTSEVADEQYIREKILDPQQKRMKAGQIEMPSFKGVLSEVQLESITLYIKSLAGRVRDE
ncbi:MAG: c-type cytochrome [Verrucomicrobia bacterium]|nr:c-type cytochrome [Verrucomicrobiota bacterium]